MTPHQLSFVLLAPRFTKRDICVSISGRTKRTDEEHTTRSEFGVCKSRGAWPRSSQNPSGRPPPPHGRRQMFSTGWPLCFRAAWWQRRSGRAVTRTWESGLNSRHSLLWSRVPSGLHLLQLISHLACVVRALCQTHRLWKNNLTGFNLPPPHATPLSLLPLALFFRSVCVALRRREPILFGSSRLLLRVRKGRFEASSASIYSWLCLVHFLLGSISAHAPTPQDVSDHSHPSVALRFGSWFQTLKG